MSDIAQNIEASSLESQSIKVEDLVQDSQAAVDGEGQEDDAAEVEAQEAPQTVTVTIVTPTHHRTLPKRASGSTTSFQSLTLLPQPHETIQELKLAVNEYVGGYWLGPYSLRIPKGKGRKAVDGEAELHKKEGIAEIKEGDRLSEWLEVGDVFAGFQPTDERVLEVIREPYSDFSARQTVLRLVELISSPGSSEHSILPTLGLNAGSSIFEAVRDGTISGPAMQEVEVALPGKKTKGKKEVIKVKKEGDHAFSDWKGQWPLTSLGSIPMSQALPEHLPCLKSISVSPFNPPAPHLRQQGHQLYLSVTLLEGDTFTLVCTSSGWYFSRSTTSTFDPGPRSLSGGSSSSAVTHSLIDLLHSISPQFSDRMSKLQPLSTTPPAIEPISTVAIPQAEPAFPFLTTPPKNSQQNNILKSQLAYLHTGATTADSLDGARDWNEEIQAIRELPKASMQERVIREKMAQKTFAEFTAASVKGVLAVARGDIPPLNPTEDARAHMFLISNIFITKAVDSIDAYAHLGGDAAAHVSHGKDAQGVKLLNKLDIDGVSLLGHTVVDWSGERWICQSMLPGIFSRHRDEIDSEEAEDHAEASEKKESSEDKKEEWVQVNGSPTKSADGVGETSAEPEFDKLEEAENPLIIHGMDSEKLSTIHWDSATHKVMAKIATANRLALHKVSDGHGQDYDFYASAEVKALRGTDGRRYLLDLPRLNPVDIEWLEKDIDGKAVGSEEDAPTYPHRLVLLRAELVETFWESELKRWARDLASKKSEDAQEKEKSGENVEKGQTTEEPENAEAAPDSASPAEKEAAAKKEESETPLDNAIDAASLTDFHLSLNPDAFVDQPLPKIAKASGSNSEKFVSSQNTDESDAAIKAVRDASLFLRQVAIPALVLDTLTGSVSGIMDGASLSRAMHTRGINMRYLGYLVSTIDSFSKGPNGEKREAGPLSALKNLALKEMIIRAAKHTLRPLLVGLQPEQISCALSHFLNCLLGSNFNAEPEAVNRFVGLEGQTEDPAYLSVTPENLRQSISEAVKCRFRFALPDEYLESGLARPQTLREITMRFGIQLLDREYLFEKPIESANGVDRSQESSPSGKSKADKKNKKKGSETTAKQQTTFAPSDILTTLPIIKSTAPSCTVAEEIFEAGRATINRGSLDLGLEFVLEAVQLYENIHSVIHPEVAAAYNQYASTVHQLARLKMQQVASENADLEQPLGLDIGQALRLQRQAVIIAERTLGVYHPDTCAYYFNLAMLENLEGDSRTSLRYFRHVLEMWDVIYGDRSHPEVNTVLSNVGVVLQTMSEHALSLAILLQAHESTASIFGQEHISTAHSLHQLTQAHFLAGDIPAALASSEKAAAIFEKTYGKEHGQTKEVVRNVELLKTVADSYERQKAVTDSTRQRQLERLHAAQARVGASSRRRLGTMPASGVPDVASKTTVDGQANGASEAINSRIGERGHLDVDELVNFIQGGAGSAKTSGSRAKHSLRGKRRTGAKR